MELSSRILTRKYSKNYSRDYMRKIYTYIPRNLFMNSSKYFSSDFPKKKISLDSSKDNPRISPEMSLQGFLLENPGNPLEISTGMTPDIALRILQGKFLLGSLHWFIQQFLQESLQELFQKNPYMGRDFSEIILKPFQRFVKKFLQGFLQEFIQ